MTDIVVQRAEGMYCPAGDFYIDPWRGVENAVITHAHGDHARVGNARYLAVKDAEHVLRTRLGDINLQTLGYGERLSIRDVTLSFHSAGHVLGSAQVRIEHRGEVWVASGDYKAAPDFVAEDTTCAPFEPVSCHTFITESTFGLPIYRWRPQSEIMGAINDWWRDNARAHRASVLFAYAFGKAQRVLSGIDSEIGPIVCHGAVENLNRAYRESSVRLPATMSVTDVGDPASLRQSLVIAPPSAQGSSWLKRFGDYSDAFASGWMQLRGARRRRAVDRGFVLSDHADWPGLLQAIEASGASRVIVTHGQVPVMVRWLVEHGLQAQAFETEFGQETGRSAAAMKRFSALFTELDSSTSTSAKLTALQDYFAQATPADAAWAVYFLSGGKPRQVVPTRALRDLATRMAGIDEWLFDECYQAVGDLAETIALILPSATRSDETGFAAWIEDRLLPLKASSPVEVAAKLSDYWNQLDAQGRFLLIKLIGGGFRVGVSKLLVTRALAQLAGLDPKVVAQRMMGYPSPAAGGGAAAFLALIAPAQPTTRDDGYPYPFFLAHQLDAAQSLGQVSEWQVEWKFDGIRAQIVRRGGHTWVWSRGEELVSDRFPEVLAAAASLPDGCVLDGEILVWKEGLPAPFALLQRRIGRKTVSAKVLKEAPVVFMAYDILELDGIDLRNDSQADRRRHLEAVVSAHPHPNLALSEVIVAADWDSYARLREESRERGVEGLMLKRRDARYGTGRTKDVGLWWKWKVDPYTVDGVLVYAQAGHGRRASLYTDYTFAVWKRPPVDADEAARALGMSAGEAEALGLPSLVPFAKAYSGLSDEEIRKVDAVIRQTTIEKFGPVRSVKPTLVFELGFEGVQASPRHKSGIAVRFPRMLRWRLDKPVAEADSLATLQRLIDRGQGRMSVP